MLRSDEVAARLGVSVSKVYRPVHDGVLKARKEGYALRIYEESVRKYLRTQGR
jgi:excisionase family DNA binding protein